MQKSLDERPNPFLFKLEKRLIEDYNLMLAQEELLWYQKSRAKWIKYGDRNTSYFHATTIIKRRKNRITALKANDGTWCFEMDALKKRVLYFYQQLYTCDSNCHVPANTAISYPRLTNAGIASLAHPVTNMEVREAVFN